MATFPEYMSEAPVIGGVRVTRSVVVLCVVVWVLCCLSVIRILMTTSVSLNSSLSYYTKLLGVLYCMLLVIRVYYS